MEDDRPAVPEDQQDAEEDAQGQALTWKVRKPIPEAHEDDTEGQGERRPQDHDEDTEDQSGKP